MFVIACLISRNDILERFSRVLFVASKCVCYIQTQSMRGTKRAFFYEGLRWKGLDEGR
jgi:hypothetical protein